MNRKIKILDTTLRDGEQAPGYSMNPHAKKEAAIQLEKLKVDIIEAGFAPASPGDFESVSEISRIIKNAVVAGLCRALVKDIDCTYDALRHAQAPRIHIVLATSPIHMRYKLKMTEDEILERAVSTVSYAKKYCADVEFSAEDASRSDKGFLAKVFSAVINAGATVINIADTVGYFTPDEIMECIYYLKKYVDGIERAEVSVHCHNDLGLAVANTLASVKAGAAQIECTVNGIGERAGIASLEEVVMNLHIRGELYNNVTCNIDTKRIYRISRLIQKITGIPVAPNKPIVGDNAFAHEAGIHQHGIFSNCSTYEIIKPQDVGVPKNKIVLGKHSGKHAFNKRLAELGYSLSKNDADTAFTQFKILADTKKSISDEDLYELIHNKFL